MRAVANTTIHLGLVSAPVQLFKATKSNDIKLNLCAPDGSPVEQVYRKKGTDEIVGTVKDCEKSYEGYMIDRETLKLIEDEAKVEDGKSLKHLHINSFIPLKKAVEDFSRITGWYYIGSHPKDGNLDAFATIVKAMERKKKAAVCKWVPKSRQEMLVLYVQNGMLYGVSLAFNADVQEPPANVEGVQGVKVDKANLEMAETLIDSMTDDEASALSTFEDSAIAKKLALVEAAKKGEKIEVTASEPVTAGEDLMAALKASIKEAA